MGYGYFRYRYLTSMGLGYLNKIYNRVVINHKRKLIRLKPHRHRLLSAEEGNAIIKDRIISGEPFVAARIGGCEMTVVNGILAERAHIGTLTKRRKQQLVTNAGFFPYQDDMFSKFADINIELSKYCDVYAMFNWINSGYLYDEYVYPNGGVPALSDCVQPYFFDDPWSSALKGKTVLVIHPFTETIASQYAKNREKLFENKNVLPEFELKTMKAVQTIAGTKDERFETWFDALDFMTNEALKIDFDIAIIGCGAYGYPLAMRLKAAGKQAVHMGGATQLLFGVKGKRWETEPIAKEFNEYWVRPREDERVKSQEKVENACYW